MEMLKQILLIYAVINLAVLPVMTVALFFLQKKTRLLDRINDAVDGVLYGENAKPAAGAPAAEKNEGLAERESEHVEGISRFALGIGDTYFCRVSSISRNSIIYDSDWISENEFVGTLDDKGIFTAKKEGVVRIFSVRKGDSFDTGATVYEITVRPANPAWPVGKVISAIASHGRRMDVVASCAGRRIVSDIPRLGVLALDGNDQEKRRIYQFNGQDELVRAILVLRNSPQARIALESGLSDRFERLKTAGDVDVWIHQFIDDVRNEVDLYAIVTEDAKGNLLLGISEMWREDGDIDEFLDNIGMTVKIFSDCLPEFATLGVALTERPVTTPPSRPILPAHTDDARGDDKGREEESSGDAGNNDSNETGGARQAPDDDNEVVIDDNDIPDTDEGSEERKDEEEDKATREEGPADEQRPEIENFVDFKEEGETDDE